jgi:predicted DNA-binding transcriptional regulator YafY
MTPQVQTRRIARLVAALAKTDRGRSVGQLLQMSRVSRATLYRDIKLLAESGYQLQTETVNGEAHYRLQASGLSVTPMTPTERAAIALARRGLSALEGSSAARELDALLGRGPGDNCPDGAIRLAVAPQSYDPEIVRVIDAAISKRRKLEIEYQGSKDKHPRSRTVHPLELRVVDQHGYLIAWDDEPRDQRIFKFARIMHARMLREKASAPTTQGRTASATAVKIWSSEPIDVSIRIHREGARYVREWPLTPDQSVDVTESGAVDVRARVYGLQEALRWTLRWGRHAEILAPDELRDLVTNELRAALARYSRGPRPQRRGPRSRTGRS